MRILLLCKRHYTSSDLLRDRFGRLYHLPLHWSREAAVQVICLDYRGRAPERLREGNLDILSLPARPGHFASTLATLRQEIRDFAPTHLVASSDILYGALGLLIARQRGIPFAYDLYDDYRTFRINRVTGLAAAFLPVCRRADLLLCASDPLRHALAGTNPRTRVVGNGYDPALFKREGTRAARTGLGIADDDILLVYPGAPGPHLDVDLIVAALERLRREGLPVKCLLVGPGSEAVAGRSPALVPHPRITQSELAPLLRSADIGIAPYRNTPQTRVSAPCKIAEFLACGLPCVAADVSDIAHWQPHGVLSYAPGDATAFADRLRSVLAHPPRVTPVEGLRWDSLARDTLAALRALPATR